MNADTIASAFIEGYDSRTSGTGSCKYTQGSDEFDAWHAGFSDGAEEAASNRRIRNIVIVAILIAWALVVVFAVKYS